MTETRQVIASRRRAWDRSASIAIGAAGAAVIALILLILAYLLYVALPLASPAKLQASDRQALTFDGALAVVAGDVLLSLPSIKEEPQGKLASSGQHAVFLSGDELQVFDLLLPKLGSGSRSGEASLRARIPAIAAVPDSLSIDSDDQGLMFAYFDRDGILHAGELRFSATQKSVIRRFSLPQAMPLQSSIQVDARVGLVLVIEGVSYYRWMPKGATQTQVPRQSFVALEEATKLVAWGPGHETLLVVDRKDRLHRFDTSRPEMPRLGTAVPTGMNVRWLASESRRRVSYLAGAGGELLVLVPSSGDELLREAVPELTGPGRLGIGGEGGFLYRISSREFVRVPVQNFFPETGWRSLWLPQWFGAYAAPAHVWHPDGAAIGALSKLSLTPLLYGTFKAALYGMLLAIPLALGAAVYTGYFLPPRIRNRIKPSIEMLEAFPTVVLGFVAGLWLAPLLLNYLLPILLLPLLLLGLPILLSVMHLVSQLLSPRFQRRPPRIALVALAYLLAVFVLLMNANTLETWLFDVSLRDWLWREWGIAYEQRNALLVGMAMGVAITPVMFSIVEDSIFAVPRSLSDGSLALGATRWQSLARVVLPAASPAILSALLIGLARGLGETMIVLLATGNTPLMEPGGFSGLRSLSASIVAELPEAGAESVQFRLLFLAALVLFGLTFVLNTVAEFFRQRLRYAYANR